MFVRTLSIDRITPAGEVIPCPVKWIDSFAMRNFTNDAVFDDTLPVADGVMEAGLRVPLALLQERMADWFRRKGYLSADESLRVTQLEDPLRAGASLRDLQLLRVALPMVGINLHDDQRKAHPKEQKGVQTPALRVAGPSGRTQQEK